MANIWFWFDPHFFHQNILKFKRPDGTLVRPEFIRHFPNGEVDYAESLSFMHETLVERHNAVVRPGDRVYWGGDISMKYGPELASLMARFTGHKRLLLGNHDQIKGTNLATFFQKISLWRIFKEEGFIATHVPLPFGQFRCKVKMNIHGHLHTNHLPEICYWNLCVENIHYTPVSIEEITAKIALIPEGLYPYSVTSDPKK
jgi:calcineurin-like phosphoesterase family protein